MEELRVFEDGMVPVYETSTGEKVVYGTELHKVLGVKSNYRDWVKNRLKDVDSVEKEDYETAKILAPSGQSKLEHIIKLDIAKEMAMLERNERGKQVRRYFIQVERRYKVASETVAMQMGRLLEALEMQSQRIDELENRIGCGTVYSRNPFASMDLLGRKQKLDGLVDDVARLYKLDKAKVLHYLYQTVEENLKVSIDGVKSFYRMETDHDGMSTFEAVIRSDRLYAEAVRLCEETVERKGIFG